MNEVPTLPQTEVSNLRKATPGELAQEVITLRLYTAQLYLEVKKLQVQLGELTGGAPARLIDAEASILDLRNRVFTVERTVITLERANDERNRSTPTS